jgi:hypothetical protein
MRRAFRRFASSTPASSKSIATFHPVFDQWEGEAAVLQQTAQICRDMPLQVAETLGLDP